MIQVSPSILSADFLTLADTLRGLEAAGADMIHCDVMDGIFVPNLSFGVPVIESVRRHTALPMDVHLMIDRPHRYVEQFARVADLLGFHYEAGSDCAALLRRIRALGVKSCLTIKPGTQAEEIFPLLPLCDMVLVMSVEPGFGGQKFLPSALEKLKALRAEIRRQGLDILLEVDGGINLETAAQCAAAGADVLVAGNFVFSAPDPGAVVRALKER